MKDYTAPALVEYGDIALLTARSNDSLSEDFEFQANGEISDEGLGSLNSCVFQTHECLFEGE